jgi:hypothetical protein
MKPALLAILTFALYALHQDFWLWRTARPLVFGFLPAGLFYHAIYCLLAAAWMAVLVKLTWPARLEREVEDRPEDAAR